VTLVAAFALVGGLWATTAQAQIELHSVSGNARSQIGNGLPIPIGFTPPPTGQIKFPPGGVLQQTTGPDPKAIINSPGGVTWPGPPGVIGVFIQNPKVFQVFTALPITGPKFKGTFKAGGRTGASTVSWCPGQTVTPAGNPGCLNPGGGIINGLMVYKKTVAQFGGPNQGNVGGVANVALKLTGTPVGSGTTVQAIFALATPDVTGAQGAAFGLVTTTAGAAPAPPNGIGKFIANANGTLIGPPISQNTTQPGLPNPVTAYGAPYTTGMLTIQVTALTTPETFTMTGSDARVNGVGTLSLVAGSISNRTLSGPNANRAWLNYTVGPIVVPTPAISKGGLAAAFGLLALAGGYVLRRRSRF